LNLLHQEWEKAKTQLEQKKQILEKDKNTPDTSDADLAQVKRKMEVAVMERVESAITLEVTPSSNPVDKKAFIQEAIQTMDAYAVAKIKCIQAEADKALVLAEAGLASQELTNAQAEVARLDVEQTSAKVKAKALLTAARKILAETGRDDAEANAFITVCPLNILTQDACNAGSVEDLEAQLEEEERSLKANQQANAVGVMEAYEKRAEEIKTIEQRMANRQEEIDSIAAQIT
jgi:hypothetical protein